MIAVLLHNFAWRAPTAAIDLDEHIALAKFSGSHIQRMYRRLCLTHSVEGGEPLHFETYLRLRSGLNRYEDADDLGDPGSRLAQAANILVAVTAAPIGFARVIASQRDPAAPPFTEVIWRIGPWLDTLDLPPRRGWPTVTSQVAEVLPRMWKAVQACATTESSGRIGNALTYFQYAWRSHHLDQACLHLAVALEVLFAPHSQAETSHQISFNLSRFLATTPKTRESTYEMARNFYRVRSGIVHGGAPEFQKIRSVYRTMFPLLARALRRILCNPKLVATFEQEPSRRELFRSFMFS